MGIEKEYSRAIALRQTDYATELIHWGELYADPKDATQQAFIRNLKAKHEESMGVGDLRISLDIIQKRFENLQHGNPFSQITRNLTSQALLTKHDPEFAAFLKQAAA